MKPKNKINTFFAVLALAAVILLVIIPQPAIAQSPAQVTLAAPSSVQPNSSFTVRVVISQVANLDAATYTVIFNSGTLRLDNITEGLIGSKTVPVDTWNNSPAGNCIVVQNLPGLTGATGTGGCLSVLHFHVLAITSGTATISLSNMVLSNIHADPIPVTLAETSINIVAPAPPSTPSPPAGELPKSPTTQPTTPTPSQPQPPASPPLQPVPKLPPRTASGGAELIDGKGAFKEDYSTNSGDKKVQLTIAKGTTGTAPDKKPIAGISVYKVARPPDSASKYAAVGSAYNFGPDGTTFAPPITLTLAYTDKQIPEDINEKSLVIGYRDEKKSEWVEVKDSKLDAEAKTITARVDHFTTFAIMANTDYVPPAVFSIADLKITPQEVSAGSNVNISALVSNKGEGGGSYDVNLKINGAVEKTQTVEVAAGQSQTVNFTASKKDAGKYTVNVNDLSSTFSVVKAKPAEETPSDIVPPVDELMEDISNNTTFEWIRGVLELVGVGAVMVVLVFLIFKGKLV